MRRTATATRPGTGPLDEFLAKRLPPSHSGVRDIYRETTMCYPYMCGYAYRCTEKGERAAQVLTRRCMRYLPGSMRVQPVISELALDLLARRRVRGEKLSAGTIEALDRLRPAGPLRRPA
jgi:hypothetical protein